jgi:hypothetical protein
MDGLVIIFVFIILAILFTIGFIWYMLLHKFINKPILLKLSVVILTILSFLLFAYLLGDNFPGRLSGC